MVKRLIISLSVLMISFVGIIIRLHGIAVGDILRAKAEKQNFYTLKIARTRGKIYDCRNVPLLGKKTKILAAVIPSAKTFEALLKVIPKTSVEDVKRKFQSSSPFLIEINKKINCEGIDCFEIPIRYSKITLAPHILGHILKNGKGVCGIERAFDEYLGGETDIEIKYEIDATGKLIRNDSYLKNSINQSGVVLHIDKRIQVLAEQIANEYILKGAVIVTEVPNCEIRACVSLPGFLPDGVQYCLKDKNSPLINRAFCQYNLGSIFKLVTAAAALESGFNENQIYNCQGMHTLKDDMVIRCFHGISHGEIKIDDAIALSCNGFFAKISKEMNSDFFLEFSKNLGFGKAIQFAEHMASSEGNLPTQEDLLDEKKLTMFSFGQGCLMATPVQISSLINTICCGGIYSKPKLVKSLVNDNMELTDLEQSLPKRVFRSSTATKLKNYMQKAILEGTAKRGKPETVSASAKTSTAETGILDDNGRINQSWFAGFFPFENPKYCIVVLSENDDGGAKNCGPVFKELADKINSMAY